MNEVEMTDKCARRRASVFGVRRVLGAAILSVLLVGGCGGGSNTTEPASPERAEMLGVALAHYLEGVQTGGGKIGVISVADRLSKSGDRLRYDRDGSLLSAEERTAVEALVKGPVVRWTSDFSGVSSGPPVTLAGSSPNPIVLSIFMAAPKVAGSSGQVAIESRNGTGNHSGGNVGLSRDQDGKWRWSGKDTNGFIE